MSEDTLTILQGPNYYESDESLRSTLKSPNNVASTSFNSTFASERT